MADAVVDLLSDEDGGAASGDVAASRPLKRPAPASQGDDAGICSICHDDWAATGAHRVCALPCGHLYGHSCIVQWWDQALQQKRLLTCPVCRKQYAPQLSELSHSRKPLLAVTMSVTCHCTDLPLHRLCQRGNLDRLWAVPACIKTPLACLVCKAW